MPVDAVFAIRKEFTKETFLRQLLIDIAANGKKSPQISFCGDFFRQSMLSA